MYLPLAIALSKAASSDFCFLSSASYLSFFRARDDSAAWSSSIIFVPPIRPRHRRISHNGHHPRAAFGQPFGSQSAVSVFRLTPSCLHSSPVLIQNLSFMVLYSSFILVNTYLLLLLSYWKILLYIERKTGPRQPRVGGLSREDPISSRTLIIPREIIKEPEGSFNFLLFYRIT